MNTTDSTIIDIHAHFLNGVDDGSQSLEQSLAMIKQAEANGISFLAATPHATDMTNDALSQLFLDTFARLQREVQRAKIQVDIVLGAELFFSPHIYEWFRYPWATFNNNKKYLLFELPLYELPGGVSDFIFQCRLKGLTPILAHPERYHYMHKMERKLLEWHRQGCLLQTNAGSVTGQFGQKVQSFARRLLKAHLVHFIASDAHDEKYRSYELMPQAREITLKFLPEWYVDQLFKENPQKALAGAPLQPPAVNTHELTSGWRKLLSRFG